MGTAEENKALHAEYWRRLTAGDLEGMDELLADNFRSWSPKRGYLGKKETREFAEWFRTLLVDWFVFEEPVVTAEGNRVCAATSSLAKLKNGNTYNNHYHFLHIIEDGKIVETQEHNDSLHVLQVLGDLTPPGRSDQEE